MVWGGGIAKISHKTEGCLQQLKIFEGENRKLLANFSTHISLENCSITLIFSTIVYNKLIKHLIKTKFQKNADVSIFRKNPNI